MVSPNAAPYQKGQTLHRRISGNDQCIWEHMLSAGRPAHKRKRLDYKCPVSLSKLSNQIGQ